VTGGGVIGDREARDEDRRTIAVLHYIVPVRWGVVRPKPLPGKHYTELLSADIFCIDLSGDAEFKV
jgi:hypothetical protein